ncbi:MAG: hypothetical protein QNJ55_04795 [Xenococcus sp. MO_188.B8]|nr:hypothetical protein [Xenococcus sp. MO_188.B8]
MLREDPIPTSELNEIFFKASLPTFNTNFINLGYTYKNNLSKAISKRSAKPRLRRAAAPSGGNGGSNKTKLTSDTNSLITETPHPGAAQARGAKMSGVVKIEIIESAETLRELLKNAKTPQEK